MDEFYRFKVVLKMSGIWLEVGTARSYKALLSSIAAVFF